VSDEETREEVLAKADALNHPLRLTIMTLLTLQPLSASELSRRLGAPIGSVRYQLGRLRKAGIAELREQRPKRGMVEQVYAVRPALVKRAESSHLTQEQLDSTVKTILKQMIRDALDSVTASKFCSRPEFVAARFPLRLDAEGWEQISTLQEEALERILALQEESTERLTADNSDPIEAFSSLFLFEAGDSGRGGGD
jgi:DNA-binding transcriptional ArsR family regulator